MQRAWRFYENKEIKRIFKFKTSLKIIKITKDSSLNAILGQL